MLVLKPLWTTRVGCCYLVQPCIPVLSTELGECEVLSAFGNEWTDKYYLPVFFGRTEAKAEAPILWPPDAKSRLIGKDPVAGEDWGQEEKGATEDETVGWHHWVIGHEFEQTLGDREGKPGVLQSMGSKRVRQNWVTELKLYISDLSVSGHIC